MQVITGPAKPAMQVITGFGVELRGTMQAFIEPMHHCSRQLRVRDVQGLLSSLLRSSPHRYACSYKLALWIRSQHFFSRIHTYTARAGMGFVCTIFFG